MHGVVHRAEGGGDLHPRPPLVFLSALRGLAAPRNGTMQPVGHQAAGVCDGVIVRMPPTPPHHRRGVRLSTHARTPPFHPLGPCSFSQPSQPFQTALIADSTAPHHDAHAHTTALSPEFSSTYRHRHHGTAQRRDGRRRRRRPGAAPPSSPSPPLLPPLVDVRGIAARLEDPRRCSSLPRDATQRHATPWTGPALMRILGILRSDRLAAPPSHAPSWSRHAIPTAPDRPTRPTPSHARPGQGPKATRTQLVARPARRRCDLPAWFALAAEPGMMHPPCPTPAAPAARVSARNPIHCAGQPRGASMKSAVHHHAPFLRSRRTDGGRLAGGGGGAELLSRRVEPPSRIKPD